MKDGKGTFNVLASVEKHIEALKPLLPRQAVVSIGEYSIKALVKQPGITKDGPLPILIEKSSDEIDKWLPRNFNPYFVLDLEDARIETHFWYNVLPYISKDESVIESLKKKSLEKLHGALIFSSVWDGIGSATLPTMITKLKASNINSLAMAVIPSKLQPTDAQFNTLAALKMCQTIEGTTVLLMDRDHLESYEGVDRQGAQIKGNMVANYLINLFLAKETLVDEVTELSRTFNSKLFTVLLVTGASYKIYGTLENMLNTALLKPFLKFDLSSATLLYVLLRMPATLKDKLPRGKIELAIANWFENKATLKSIHITEPIYTEDMSDRIDVTLLIGGFDADKMLSKLEERVQPLKEHAVEKGLITEDWQVTAKIEEPPATPAPIVEDLQNIEEPPEQTVENTEPAETTEVAPSASETILPEPPIPPQPTAPIEEPKVTETQTTETTQTADAAQSTVEPTNAEIAPPPVTAEKVEEPKPASKPKRTRRTRKATAKKS